MSETERVLKTRTEHHAAIMQKRRSGEGAKKTADKEAKVPKQQVLNSLDHSVKNLCLMCSFIPCSTCAEWEIHVWWPTCYSYYMYNVAGLIPDCTVCIQALVEVIVLYSRQDTLFSQCLSPPRCINRYWEI